MKFFLWLLLGWCAAHALRAQTAVMTPQATTYAASGGAITFTVTLEYPATTTAVSFEVGTVPAGWTFAAMTGENPPPIAPQAGDSGPFGFAYTNVPPNGATFSFRVNYPAGLQGAQRFASLVMNLPGPRAVSAADVVLTPAGTATPPTITTQPAGANVLAGGSVTFTVAASGTPPLSYQWRKDNAAIAGATAASFALDNVAATHAGNYSVVVTNAAGSVASANAVLAVASAPVAPQIVTPPQAQTVALGASATFSVAATGTAPLRYQWRKDGVALEGADSAVLTLTNVPASAAGAYSVVVTNVAGSAASAAATLTVSTEPLPETPLAGVWFGNLASNAGSFALLLRPDRTGAFLAWERGARQGFVARQVSVEAAGAVKGEIAPGIALEASIAAGGMLTGRIAGRVLTLAGTTRAASGATLPLAGFFQAGAAGRSATAFVIVGPNGAAYALLPAAQESDAGLGTISSAGAIDIATERGGRLAGAVNAASATLALLYSPASGASTTFAGANDDGRVEFEKLINISTRSRTGGSAGELTAGFVLTGDQPKTLLVRGVGPTLAGFGLSGALSAAQLEIFRVSGGTVSIASGGDWGAGTDAAAVAAAAARVGAFALPANSRDAALLLTVNPGAYTAVLSGPGGASGIALVEIYDATTGAIPRAPRLINISTRAIAGAGEEALVAGFVIRGDVPKRVLVRGAGPALAAFGINGVLAAPQLALHAGETVLARNAGWSSPSAEAADLALAAQQVGAFPFAAGSQDAALLLHLQPGAYTAQITSAGAPGVALLEVYEAP